MTQQIIDFQLEIVRPVLDHLDMGGIWAERLIVGTALAETQLRHFKQIRGPALGFYQIEPNTFQDIYYRYLNTRKDIKKKVDLLLAPKPEPLQQLVTNLAFATAVARIKYWMSPEVIGDTLPELALTYKNIYNSDKGKGSTEKFIRDASIIMELG